VGGRGGEGAKGSKKSNVLHKGEGRGGSGEFEHDFLQLQQPAQLSFNNDRS